MLLLEVSVRYCDFRCIKTIVTLFTGKETKDRSLKVHTCLPVAAQRINFAFKYLFEVIKKNSVVAAFFYFYLCIYRYFLDEVLLILVDLLKTFVRIFNVQIGM